MAEATFRGFLTGLGRCVPVLAMIALFSWCEVFGVVWSFYRHGPGHGVSAVLFPPYAWFRSAAFFWDAPEWKDDWDVNVEAIGLFLFAQQDVVEQLSMVRPIQGIRKWVDTLPPDVRQRLRHSLDGYADAFVDYYEEMMTALANGEEPPKPDESRARLHLQKFEAEAGLVSLWNRTEQRMGVAVIAEKARKATRKWPDRIDEAKMFVPYGVDMLRVSCKGRMRELFGDSASQ